MIDITQYRRGENIKRYMSVQANKEGFFERNKLSNGGTECKNILMVL